MKRTEIICNEVKLQSVIGMLRSEFASQGFLRVQMSTDKPRTLSQNALCFALYGQIARESGQETEHEVRRRCKLHYGVPILRADDADYCARYDESIKPLPYEVKLRAMDYWPVTRLMSTDQLTRFAAAIEQHEVEEARAAA